MTEIIVTPMYLALTALIMLILFQAVAARRWTLRVGIGHADDPKLELRIRRFGNLIEHAPIILAMMFFMELKGVSAQSLHIFGATFIICRILHPIGLFKDISVPMPQKIARAIGVVGTSILYVVGITTLLIISLPQQSFYLSAIESFK